MGGLAQPNEFVLWGSSNGQALESVNIFIRSDEDPRYALTQEIAVANNVDGIYAAKLTSLSSCKQYFGYAVGQRAAYTDPELGEVPLELFRLKKNCFQPMH